jgi:arylsulfatase A-like enzyme
MKNSRRSRRELSPQTRYGKLRSGAFCVFFMVCITIHGLGQRRPLIVLMADQLRADVIGPSITPNIVALMEDGVDFKRAYCNAPLCAPSRASFFTGMYPNKTGALINAFSDEDKAYGIVRPGIPSLYSLMEEGWDSYHVGKQHFFTAEEIDKNTQSLTRWITQADYSKWMQKNGKVKPGGSQFRTQAPALVSGDFSRLKTYSSPETGMYHEGLTYFLDHYITDQSIRAIKARDKRKPFLLNAMFLAPHPPFHIPEPYFSMFRRGDFPVPENVGRWYPGQSPLQMYHLTGIIGSRYDRDKWLDIWPKYLGLVKLLDDEVGRLVKTLREEGLYDDALIIFTSDHGEMLGSHSLWQKMCMYEESVRVPLIMKFPKEYAYQNRAVSSRVSLVDVLPTILEVNGIKRNSNLDGQSLLSLVRGEVREDTGIFIQYDGDASLGSGQRSLVKDDFKLIVDTFKDGVFLELYNLKRDEGETENLALKAENREQVEKLLNELKQKMSASNDRLTFSATVVTDFLKNYSSKK